MLQVYFIRDNVSRANIFNKYFAYVFTRDDNNTPHFTQRVDPTAGCCNVSFTPLKVLKVLKGLKPKKNSSGPDGFSNVLLKKLAKALFPGILQISCQLVACYCDSSV